MRDSIVCFYNRWSLPWGRMGRAPIAGDADGAPKDMVLPRRMPVKKGEMHDGSMSQALVPGPKQTFRKRWTMCNGQNAAKEAAQL